MRVRPYLRAYAEAQRWRHGHSSASTQPTSHSMACLRMALTVFSSEHWALSTCL